MNSDDTGNRMEDRWQDFLDHLGQGGSCTPAMFGFASLTAPQLEEILDVASGLEGATPVLYDADFRDVVFADDAVFNEVTFRGLALFDRAVFQGIAWFTGALFTRAAWFTETIFRSMVSFVGSVFAGPAGFGGAQFGQDVGFGGARFLQEAGFGHSIFQGITWFRGTVFDSVAGFGKTFFHGIVSFEKSTFSGIVQFGGVQFARSVYFDDAVFFGRDLVAVRVSLVAPDHFAVTEVGEAFNELFSWYGFDIIAEGSWDIFRSKQLVSRNFGGNIASVSAPERLRRMQETVQKASECLDLVGNCQTTERNVPGGRVAKEARLAASFQRAETILIQVGSWSFLKYIDDDGEVLLSSCQLHAVSEAVAKNGVSGSASDGSQVVRNRDDEPEVECPMGDPLFFWLLTAST